MKSGDSVRSAKYPFGVFFLIAALLLLIHGNRFVLTNDEGILLEPAQRLAQGARPYVDFFGYMSPGSYWIQAALFRLFGTSFWVGRLPVIVGFSLQAALIFWLVTRLASRRAAAAAVLVFVGFQIADPSFLTAQHRWDSATLALAGVCCVIEFASRPGPERLSWGMATGGALLTLAAWCTPSVGLVAAVAAGWLLLARDRRGFLVPFLAGASAVVVAAAGALWITGSLGAFVNQMLWLKHNYASVNVMPYGSVIGGYQRLFEGPAGVESLVRLLIVLCLMLPAILPPLAAVLWGVIFGFRREMNLKAEVLLLLLAAAALIASTFPRADLMHLAFVAALPYALATAGLAHLLSARAGAILAFTVIPFALLFSLNEFVGAWTAHQISTPVGAIRGGADIAPDLQKLISAVHPGEALFVHPYMPIFYFLTQGRNPTKYGFLNPGMMTTVEETAALRGLESRPPQWLLYMQLTDAEFRRVFPNSGGANARFVTLESWLEKNYVLLDQPTVNIAGYRLYRRNPLP